MNPEGKKAAPAQVFASKVEDGQVRGRRGGEEESVPPTLCAWARARVKGSRCAAGRRCLSTFRETAGRGSDVSDMSRV